MNQATASFVVTLLRSITACDIIVATIGAASLWRIHRGISLAKCTGILLAAIAFDQSCQLVAGLHRPHGLVYGTWFLVWWLTGRLLRIGATLALVLYVLGFWRDRKSE